MARFIGNVETKSRGARRGFGGGASRHESAPFYTAADSQQKQKPSKGGGDGEAAKGEGGKKLEKKGKELKEEMDSLVDEIDAVLEENAEEFVKNYVQRGGQ